MKRAFVAASVAVSLLSTRAWAQQYHPDFSCAAPPPNNGVALMLCQNSDAAKHELMFDQTYYALRQIVGKDGWKALKQSIILDENAANQGCGLPIPGEGDQSIPPNGAECYIGAIDRLTEKYRTRLAGAALEEAQRPIDQHIQLQQKLIDAGYLPTGTIADGVYGETTRAAIETWQRVQKRPSSEGFISDADERVLLGDNSPPGGAPQQDARESIPPSPNESVLYKLAHPDKNTPDTPNQGSKCASDIHACRDNADIANNSNKYAYAREECKDQAGQMAKYGTPVWPGFFSGGAFGSFSVGQDGPSTGVMTLVEPNAQFQNGFGAMVHVTVRCEYNFNTESVININMENH